MEFTDFKAGKNDENRRLDRILKAILPVENQSKINQLLRKNLIKLNKKKASAAEHVTENDIISVASFLLNEEIPGDSHKNPSADKNPQIKIQSLFTNEYLKIINKPYDTLCQPAKNSTFDLSNWIQEEYKKEKHTDSLSFKPGALHRLDRFTTGLLVFSQNSQGARWFSEGIKNHWITKTYIGIAEGHLTENQLWNDKLEDEQEHTPESFHTVKSAEESSSENLKEALTQATPLAWGKYKGRDITLIKYHILTGRKHQIRFQSSYHGFPLLGDIAYGAREKGPQEYFLHALELHFPEENPLNLPVTIKAELPESFSNFIKINLKKPTGQIII